MRALLASAPEFAAAPCAVGAVDRCHRCSRQHGSSCPGAAAVVAGPRRWCVSWQQVILLVALVVDSGLFAGAIEDGELDDEDAAAKASRRLEELINRHVSFHREEAATLDARGLLPALDVGGMRLQEVFVVTKLEPWKCRHATVPPDYKAHPATRRLHELAKVPDTPLVFATPRDKVRIMAALNAAAHPPAAYNDSVLFKEAEEVYRLGKQAYWQVNITESAVLAASGEGNSSNSSNKTYTAEEIEEIRKHDVEELLKTREALREAMGTKWQNDNFLGMRSAKCEGLSSTDPQCMDDVGVSISVYDDGANQVLVFHSGFAQNDYEYIMWLNKLWILDSFEDKMILVWSIGAQQKFTKAMLERRGAVEVERHIRCAYNDTEFKIAPDMEALATAADIPMQQLNDQGLWALVKRIVRVILPEDRQIQIAKEIYLTGSGVGGMHAAFASMMLVKADDAKYLTYVIAGVGWECAARRLHKADFTTFQTHDQLHIYTHVADAYGTALDRMHGTVCLFGIKNFSGSPAQEFCSAAVGHSGPELFYRGAEPTTVKDKEAEDAELRAKYDAYVQVITAGQKNFDACHYYTHSAWYAAMLFTDENVLMLDGKTDGGCGYREPIPEEDKLKQCPVTHANEECKLLLIKDSKLPVAAMAITALSMTGLICGCGLCGICCLSRQKSDAHLYKEGGNKPSFPFCCLPVQKEGSDRAKQARTRAKEKRQKAIEKTHGVAATESEEEEVEGKKKKRKNRSKTKIGPYGTDPEAEPLEEMAEGNEQARAGDIQIEKRDDGFDLPQRLSKRIGPGDVAPKKAKRNQAVLKE